MSTDGSRDVREGKFDCQRGGSAGNDNQTVDIPEEICRTKSLLCVCAQANKRIYMYPNRNNPPAHPCNYGLTITGNVNMTNQLSEKHGINKLLQARNKDRKSESIFFKPSRSKKVIFGRH